MLRFQTRSWVWIGDTKWSDNLYGWQPGGDAESPGVYTEGKHLCLHQGWFQHWAICLAPNLVIFNILKHRWSSPVVCLMLRWAGLLPLAKCVCLKWEEPHIRRMPGCCYGRTESVFTPSSVAQSGWWWTWARSRPTVMFFCLYLPHKKRWTNGINICFQSQRQK